MKHLFKSIAVASLIAANAANAADFNFAGGGSGSTAFLGFSSGGIGLTVNVTGYTPGSNLDVTVSGNGLGVNAGLLDFPGIGNNESLTLTFSQVVNLTSLRLAEWDIPDRATLSWSGGSINLVGDGLVSTDIEALNNAVSNVFTLKGASTFTTFRLNGLTAVAAVPEPSTYAMMGLGLVGIGMVARRRAT